MKEKVRNPKHYFISSESVSAGHPDKVCDAVAAAILDAFLAVDKNAHVAIEALFVGNKFILGGEVKSMGSVDLKRIAYETIQSIGYNADEIEIEILTQAQSANIDSGVTKEDGSVGAGDQGTIWGHAVRDTNTFISLSYDIANKILQELRDIRENKELADELDIHYLLPDAKSQVTIEYDENGDVVGIDSIVLSTSHTHFKDTADEMLSIIRNDVITKVIPRVFERFDDLKQYYNDNIEYLINPAGLFEIYGANSDSSTVSRKTIVDQCGSETIIKSHGKLTHVSMPFGGGGYYKDPSKVDMSGAVMGRYIAKNCVKAGICDAMSVQLSYAIGYTKPVSVFVNTYRTANVTLSDSEIAQKITEIFDLTPIGIIKRLHLREPIYSECSSYGWFGRKHKLLLKHFYSDAKAAVKDNHMMTALFPWEEFEYVEEIKEQFEPYYA